MEILWKSRRQVLTGQGLGDFFVNNDVDFDASLGRGLEESVKTVGFVLRGRSA